MRCFHFRLCIRGRSDNLATGVPTPGTDDELLVKGRAENVSPGERGNGFSSSLSSVRDGLKVRPCVGVGHTGLDIARSVAATLRPLPCTCFTHRWQRSGPHPKRLAYHAAHLQYRGLPQQRAAQLRRLQCGALAVKHRTRNAVRAHSISTFLQRDT